MRPLAAAALIAVSTACAPKPEPVVPAPPAPATPVPPTPAAGLPTATPRPSIAPEPLQASLEFARDVQPILSRRCQPCHEPGGQMYARLPFDDAATVASHPDGILRRLKGDDRVVVERWIAAQPAAR